MASRHTIAWFILLAGLSAAIFFFLREEDNLAVSVAFLAFYGTVTFLYFMRMFYYAQYKATLNEVYFFSLANIIPLVVIGAGPFIPLGDESVLTFNIEILQRSTTKEISLSVTFLSMLAFPYLAISTALLIRSFTRYQFIRLTSQSSKGPSAEWTAIFTFFVFGGLFLYLGLFASDLLGVLYGLFYLLFGIGFLLGR
ncbi:MAG: hypothetical protein ACFFDT_27090 [Candidatus Hodarchaeota archaeon]